MMKTIYVTLVLIFSVCTLSNAQSTTADNLTKIMFEAKVTQLQEEIVSMAVMEDASLKESLMNKAAQTTDELYKKLSIQIAGTFSESEMAYLIEFYKGAVGKKLLETSDTLIGLTTTTMQDWQLSLDEILMNAN